MIKIENVEAYGFEAAVRGMRNPMNSWDKSDSEWNAGNWCDSYFSIGENDLDLMGRLFRAGTEHRKYMRQIMVSMDIVAPLYWWKEFDTYKVGTTANSCSTMHKIHAKPFTLDDFSCEHLYGDRQDMDVDEPIGVMNLLIDMLNMCREDYLDSKDKLHWWQMIQLLPTSYNQKRTVTLNYEVAYRIIEQRSHHKLDEWHVLVAELEQLPYMADIIVQEQKPTPTLSITETAEAVRSAVCVCDCECCDIADKLPDNVDCVGYLADIIRKSIVKGGES